MAFQFLDSIPNVKGLRVKISEFGEEVIGKVEFFDANTGKIGLIIENCLQLYFERDCESCQIVNESSDNDNDNGPDVIDAVESAVEKLTVQEDCQNDTKVVKAHMTEEEMRKVFKDVDPRVPNIRDDITRRRDNPHLRNLHHIKLERLLCGAPPPGEPESLTLQTGRKLS